MSVPYWPETLPQLPAPGLDYAPGDVRTTFEAATGEPISRPRTTGAPFVLEPSWTLEGAQIQTFADFYASTLGQGAARFAMREPAAGELRMWRFVGAYRRQFLIETLARVQAKLVLLPGAPWFAPYGRAGLATVPAFVADYDGGVYGIDGVKKAASTLTSIEGTYLVERTTTTQITLGQETLTAGDIPATAPADTTKIVGYPI